MYPLCSFDRKLQYSIFLPLSFRARSLWINFPYYYVSRFVITLRCEFTNVTSGYVNLRDLSYVMYMRINAQRTKRTISWLAAHIRLNARLKFAYKVEVVQIARRIFLEQGSNRCASRPFDWFLPDSFRRVGVTVARPIAATRTAKGANMAVTTSSLSSSSNMNIRRQSSAVKVSVKSVSVIARGPTTRTTGSPATTRGSPRGRADPRETVVTSVTSGASRTPVRRRRSTWDSIVIPWWTVLRVWTICAITWTPLPAVATRGRPGTPSPGWSRVGCSPFTGPARPSGAPPSARWTLIKVSFRVSRRPAELVRRISRRERVQSN